LRLRERSGALERYVRDSGSCQRNTSKSDASTVVLVVIVASAGIGALAMTGSDNAGADARER
jgi:hypothetical protein